MFIYQIRTSCSSHAYLLLRSKQALISLMNFSPTGSLSLKLPHWYSLPCSHFFFEYKHLRICVQHNCFMCVMFLQVKCLIDEAKSATPTNLSKSYATINVPGATPLVFLSNGTPPLSPRSSPGSPRFSRQRASPPSLRSPLRSVKEPKHELIPQVCLHWILLLVTFECIALLLSDRGFGLVYMFT